MSIWTHVNASIRFDGIRGLFPQPNQNDLGVIKRFGDDDYESTILPTGSEGSLEYTICKTGSESSLASMVVCFTGDLRDYDNTDEILTYFNKITSGFIVRSGILEIDVEGFEPLVYRYDSEENSFIKLKTQTNE